MLNQKRDVKVLVSANLDGRFKQVMPKVGELHSKNKFDCMLLLGSVCHPRASPFVHSLSQQQQSLPLRSYFIDSSAFSPVLKKLHPKGVEMVPGLTYLGRNGLTEIQGLKVAFFNSVDQTRDAVQFQTQLQAFLDNCRDKDVDILMTHQWPEEIRMISQKTNAKTANYVSIIANELSPRYHFAAGLAQFYRMPPYRNAKGRLTHFINVAPCLEELKDRYLFAATIKSHFYEVASQNDPKCLENPYLLQREPKQQPTNLSVHQRMNKQLQRSHHKIKGEVIVFFEGFPEWARKEDIEEFLERWGEIVHLDSYKDKKGGQSGTVRFSREDSTKQCLADSGKHMFHTNRIKFQARSMQDRLRVQDCWFCKANTDRSLIVWQGKHLYISLEKGPLCRFHIQIIPYNHTQSSTRLDPQEQQELIMVKKRLLTHFASDGYEVLSYERCLPLSDAVNHCVVHMLPIKTTQNLTKMFEKINQEDALNFKQWNGEKRSTQHYLHLTIGLKNYLRQLQRKEKVQADFMRQLLCQILETPKQVNWKMCERKPEDLIEELSAFAAELKRAGLTN